MTFCPKCIATGIGSFPHNDAIAACDIILATMPEVPVWPQLIKADFREQMEIQYSEGLPCVVINEAKNRIFIDKNADVPGELERFYENYLAENLDYFKISPEYARGLYEMEKRLLNTKHTSVQYFKTQIIGPITLGLSVFDEKKRAIYYDEMLRDAVVKGIAMKTRWLLRKFNSMGYRQICFIDEPILSAFGSSTYVSVQRTDIVHYLQEVIEAIHDEGALVGIHCCGNTEWPILIDAGVDIISLDAYGFGETIGYYPKRIKQFLEAGGAIAWGIVPTSSKINEETTESLITLLEERIDSLVKKGIDKLLLWEQCIITPSCGTGTLSVELSDKVFTQLANVKATLREKYFS